VLPRQVHVAPLQPLDLGLVASVPLSLRDKLVHPS